MRTFIAAAGTSILAAGFGAAALAPAPVAGLANHTTPTTTTACDYPADVLDLTSWKVQLPIGEDESPDEVEQPELATYEVDPWFTLTPNCDAVRFRAAVDGVTTSGSDYPRSELREMREDGSEEAAWSSTSGIHTLTIDQAVTALPNDKTHIVVGQIHDGDDDVSVFRLEGNSLYVTNGDDSHHQLVTDSYELGTRFQVEFTVTDGRIDAYYNGDLQTTISTDFTDGYFKAGAYTYTQANCENSSPCSSDNYGEVIVYDVGLNHSDAVTRHRS